MYIILCQNFYKKNQQVQDQFNLISPIHVDEESSWPHIYLEDLKNLTSKNDLKGPLEDKAVCANCEDHTTGNKCDHCKIGYFGGAANGPSICQPCSCNGHGDICDEVKYRNCSQLKF